jgi:trigger factor
MQVSLEKLSNLERKITVSVPAEEIDKKVLAELEKLKDKAKIAGFRKGKVPFNVLQQKFGKSVRDDAINEVIRSSYFDAVKQENLHPAGWPHIEPKASIEGQPLEYTATFEIMPEINLVSLQGTEITKLHSDVTDENVSEEIEKLIKQYAEWFDVERASKTGDRVIIDFEGKMGGELFPGGAATNTPVELGRGQMLPDFENALFNVTAGQEVNFDLKFPENYGDASVSGKTANFSVKVQKVQEAKIPELDPEFLIKLGIKEGGVEALRAKMKEKMQEQLKEKLASQLKNAILDKLIELNSMEVPKALVTEEIRHLQNEAVQWLARYTGKSPKDLPLPPAENFAKNAERRIRLGLLFEEIIKREQLKASPELTQAKIEELAKSYPNPQDVINAYNNDKRLMSEVGTAVLEEQVIAKLQEQCTVVTKEVSFNEAMGLNN